VHDYRRHVVHCGTVSVVAALVWELVAVLLPAVVDEHRLSVVSPGLECAVSALGRLTMPP